MKDGGELPVETHTFRPLLLVIILFQNRRWSTLLSDIVTVGCLAKGVVPLPDVDVVGYTVRAHPGTRELAPITRTP